MNIGIITFHRGFNYGASLQCYSLKTVLESYGCSVTVLDYLSKDEKEPGLPVVFDRELFNNLKRGNLRTAALYFIKQSKYRKNIAAMRKGFSLFDKQLHLSRRVSTASEINRMRFDTVILGSDQIWTDDLPYDGVYWGEGLSGKVIAYAASGIKDPQQDLHIEVLKKYVERISVRETSAQHIFGSSGIHVECVLDPVLLLGKNGIDQLRVDSRIACEYVFCYALGRDEYTMQVGRMVSDHTHVKLVWLNGVDGICQCSDGTEFLCDGPGGFVGILSKAKYVITNSFHGTVLSLLYHIPFYATLYRNKTRVFDLLHRFHLESRLLDSTEDVPYDRLNEICWDDFDSILNTLQKHSKEYLEEALCLKTGMED